MDTYGAVIKLYTVVIGKIINDSCIRVKCEHYGNSCGFPQIVYDKDNKRHKQVDVSGMPHKIDEKGIIPHTHLGYYHGNEGSRKISERERRMIDRVKRIWYNHLAGK